MNKEKTLWHNLKLEETFKILNSSKSGLSSQEAKKRQAKFGQNILATGKKFSLVALFFGQFKSALVYVLLIAAIVSLVFKEFVDAGVIFAAVILNVVIGFVQEKKANLSLEKLKSVVKPEALVLRDGKQVKILSQDLVAGDIVYLTAGDRVPADIRLFEVIDFKTNEAPLTGESWPQDKQIKILDKGAVLAERTNLALMGTLAVEGRASGVVVAIDNRTEIGKIASLLAETKEERTPLQKNLDNFAKNITKVIVAIVVLIFILGLLEGQDWLTMFSVAVALAVSAIPEGLVIGVTMILTLGIIFTNKHLLALDSQLFREVLTDPEIVRLTEIAFLCNNAQVANLNLAREDWEILGSPTEKALLLFGILNKHSQKLDKRFQRKQELPFDSRYKYMITRHSYDDKNDILFIKGAVEKVLQFSDHYLQHVNTQVLNSAKRKSFLQVSTDLSSDGLRVLAAAYKLIPRKTLDLAEYKIKPNDFVFAGLMALSDPLRPDTRATLQAALQAGIKTVIITGDNKFTAHKIANDLDLKVQVEDIIDGDDLLNFSDEELAKRITEIQVYARVTSADKLRIIKAWQDKGEVVAMTGDGVNDAPALKAADIGVVVASGSDVAKEVADVTQGTGPSEIRRKD
ncbi:MAG: Calcium-transporting ATPase, partial [Parcubacteria group bacterium GW2011_GWA2_36_10]